MYRPVYAVIHQEIGESDYIVGLFSSRKKAEICIEQKLKETFTFKKGGKVRNKYEARNFVIGRYELNFNREIT